MHSSPSFSRRTIDAMFIMISYKPQTLDFRQLSSILIQHNSRILHFPEEEETIDGVRIQRSLLFVLSK